VAGPGAHHDEIAGWVEAELTGVKIHELLARRGVEVPCRTVQRYVLEVCGRRRGRGPKVRVVDGEPGDDMQIDFGRMGFIVDAAGRRRVVWALIFTACYSRHCFVWLTFRQTTETVIAGCEAAWRFFGGVFTTVIPDNLKAIVDGADACEPGVRRVRASPRVRDRSGPGAASAGQAARRTGGAVRAPLVLRRREVHRRG
jgi:transposase